MAPWEVDAILKGVIREVSKRLNIQVYGGFDLRQPRALKQTTARNNKTWTLFINRKGSLCHAVHQSGALIILESPQDLHNCFHEEYAMNYFINHIREITKAMFTSV